MDPTVVTLPLRGGHEPCSAAPPCRTIVCFAATLAAVSLILVAAADGPSSAYVAPTAPRVRPNVAALPIAWRSGPVSTTSVRALRQPALEDALSQSRSPPASVGAPASSSSLPFAAVVAALGFLAGLAVSPGHRRERGLALLAAAGEAQQDPEAAKQSSEKTETPEKTKVEDTTADIPRVEATPIPPQDDTVLDLDDFDAGAPSDAPPPEPQPLLDTETVIGDTEAFGFETNTRQILDIVARSLYHDKEVFIRELISNASDAIEKYRYLKLVTDQELEPPPEPRISVYSDPVKNTFIIQDTGVGMTKEELKNNLGTIASSGSKQLIEKLQAAQKDTGDSLIGQFGVGFYSAFIVADRVRLFTRSCVKGSQGYLWESDGHGNYSITEAEGVAQGTKIVVALKEEEKDFTKEDKLEKIVQKYSSFISTPIVLNGKRVNAVQALWRRNPKDVTEEQYTEFYKYIANAYDKPKYTLHYRVDAPVDVKAVLFVPEYNMEMPGRNRLKANVSLYCKNVLIKAKCEELLPEWMRFVSGVVDSEDLPLNVSREGSQDSRAFQKLSKLVTNRVLKWLADEAGKDKKKYDQFFKEFGYFLKEGLCMDQSNKVALGKLMRFESSKLESGELTSFDEYIERYLEGQDRIYFLHTPSRQTAILSPYYEQLQKRGVEVLFMYGQLDEYLMTNYTEHKENKMVSIENMDLGLDAIKSPEASDEDKAKDEREGLSPKQCKRFTKFLVKALPDRCSDARPSDRLVDSPAIIAAGFEQSSMFRHLRQIANLQGKASMGSMPMGQQTLEFNPKHPIVQRLYWLTRDTSPEAQGRAKMMAEQIFDNALIASGLLEDPRLMLTRLNSLLADSLADVRIEKDDEPLDPEEDKEEPVAKPERRAGAPPPPRSPEQEAQVREMLEKGFEGLSEEDREKMTKMMEESVLQSTQGIDPDLDFDMPPPPSAPRKSKARKAPQAEVIKEAEFTPEPPKQQG